MPKQKKVSPKKSKKEVKIRKYIYFTVFLYGLYGLFLAEASLPQHWIILYCYNCLTLAFYM